MLRHPGYAETVLSDSLGPVSARSGSSAVEKPRAEEQIPDRLIGQVVDGKYLIREKLGKGGMGSVYRAEQMFLERPVAIKLLHRHLVESEDFLRRFRQEARITSRLRHPNVVMLFDYGVWDGLPYLVMELAEGPTLRDRVAAEGPLSIEALQSIVPQIAMALHEAHSAGIVHRDLKPENIVLSFGEDGAVTARVLDFGIAKLLIAPPDTSSIAATEAGTFFGTPRYASPEQALGRDLDPRSDIYSLGVVLYEAASGSPPFRASSSLELLMKHVSERPAPLRRHRPEIPPVIETIVARCLEKDPEYRFQNVLELTRMLSAGSPPEPPRRIGSKRHALAGAAALCAVLAVAGAGAVRGRSATVIEPFSVAPAAAPGPVTGSGTAPAGDGSVDSGTRDIEAGAAALVPALSAGGASSESFASPPSESYEIGYGLYKEHRYEEAVPLLESAIEIEPMSLSAHLALAVSLERLKRPADALQKIERATELFPSDPVAHFAAARLATQTGDLRKALRALQRAVQLDPEVRRWARRDRDLMRLRRTTGFWRVVGAPRANKSKRPERIPESQGRPDDPLSVLRRAFWRVMPF